MDASASKTPSGQPRFRKISGWWNRSPEPINATERRSKCRLTRCLQRNVREEKKLVLQSGYRWSFFECAVHILPICATVVVAYFNLAGWFIGSSLQGLTGDTYQAIDRFCLQVTAKLLDLLIVSSISVVIMDVVSYLLLADSRGLPLGLLSAKFRFADWHTSCQQIFAQD
ncbi:hypothetical protein PV11_00529 [Exophiala sideris]|uniref:Uncharacterized protein n=1 Tax=Exophiala sideris TaxID=1016849 RepID=A0A0D1XA70_9EURO|nr:hypothetical protein PV11_00529 [Exophiala sideris]